MGQLGYLCSGDRCDNVDIKVKEKNINISKKENSNLLSKKQIHYNSKRWVWTMRLSIDIVDDWEANLTLKHYFANLYDKYIPCHWRRDIMNDIYTRFNFKVFVQQKQPRPRNATAQENDKLETIYELLPMLST
eukprot:246538_1